MEDLFQQNVQPEPDDQKSAAPTRETRSQERERRIRAASHRRIRNRILLWGIAVLAVGGIIWGVTRTNSSSVGQHAALVVPPEASDWRRGNASSQVVLVEYGDFQCPACGYYYPIIKTVEAKYQDRVGFVFRNFPLMQVHPNAILGAQAAGSAGRQGKFWEMHDLLFQHQQEWSVGTDAEARGHILQYAQNIGLDMEKFNADLNSSEVADKIKKDTDSGNASSVNSTPTFFLNGQKIDPSPATADDFGKLLDDALAKQ